MQSKTAFQLHFHSIVLLCAVAVHAGPTQAAPEASPRRVDRQALVTRHNIVLHQFDANNPLTVGNGEFAFTVDATGLQTFPEAFEQTTPRGSANRNAPWMRCCSTRRKIIGRSTARFISGPA
jgi:hypothetical protein